MPKTPVLLALLIMTLAGIACSTSAISSRCVPATQQQLQRIRVGVKAIETTNDVLSGFAVKSNDYNNVWFVAAKIHGTGIESNIPPGVWALNGDPEDTAAGAMSVNGYALSFSNWADGPKSDAKTTMSSDGAQEAYDCANK